MRAELNNILRCKRWIDDLDREINQLQQQKQEIESEIKHLKNLKTGQKISLRVSSQYSNKVNLPSGSYKAFPKYCFSCKKVDISTGISS